MMSAWCTRSSLCLQREKAGRAKQLGLNMDFTVLSCVLLRRLTSELVENVDLGCSKSYSFRKKMKALHENSEVIAKISMFTVF